MHGKDRLTASPAGLDTVAGGRPGRAGERQLLAGRIDTSFQPHAMPFLPCCCSMEGKGWRVEAAAGASSSGAATGAEASVWRGARWR